MTSRVEVSNRLVLINSVSTIATRLISISVLLWLQQYLIKRITDEEYSLLPVLYSIMMFAPLITTVLTSGLGRYIVEAHAQGNDRRVTEIVSTMFPILCGAAAIFLAIGWTIAWFAGPILNIAPEYADDACLMLAILVFCAAMRLPLAPFGVGLFVRQRFVIENFIGVGTELFRLTLLFVLLFGLGTRVLWVICASCAAELANLFLVQWLSRRMVPALRFQRGQIRWATARELTNFGGWMFLSGIAATIRNGSDALVLNWLSSAFQVNVFHFGSIPKMQMGAFSSQIKRTVLPAIVSCVATSQIGKVRRAYFRASRYALWIATLPLVPGLIYGENAFVFYLGEEYRSCAVVMNMLLGVYLFAWPSVLTPELVQASGKMRRLALTEFIMHTTNLALTLLAVGYLQWGAFGSAGATLLVTMVFHPFLLWPLGMKLAGVSLRDMARDILIPGLAPGLAHLGALGAAAWWCPQPTLIGLIALCAAGGALHAACVFALGWKLEDPYCVGLLDKVLGMRRKGPMKDE